MLSSFTFKPLRFVPHALSRPFIKALGALLPQSLAGPKAPKPEPQISGEANFSSMYPRSIGYVLLSACGGSSIPAARIEYCRSCLCFVAPKQGPDSGPKNGATMLQVVAQLPNLWLQFWAHGICVLPSAKSALSCARLHLSFMFSCAWCQDAGFTCRVRSEGRQKACRPTAPKMGPRRSASQRNVSKGAGMPVLFCSKHDCHKQCKDMRTASGSVQDPGRTPRHPQISKLTYFRTLQSYTRKGSKTSFCEWQR